MISSEYLSKSRLSGCINISVYLFIVLMKTALLSVNIRVGLEMADEADPYSDLFVALMNCLENCFCQPCSVFYLLPRISFCFYQPYSVFSLLSRISFCFY
jgi:hypothetical protein